MVQYKKIRTRDFISVFFRTFFIQAVWNFQSLISVGLGFALVPIARRLFPGDQEKRKFIRRNLYFFNSHPYFASFAIGAIARLEEERLKGNIKNEEQIERFRNALMGPLGAIGDEYFWAAIKPGSIILGVAGVAIFKTVQWQLASILFAFTAYNVPHLFIRAYGLWKGYHEGYAISRHLGIEKFRQIKNIYLAIGALMLGIFAGYQGAVYGLKGKTEIFVFVLSLLISAFLQRRKVNMYLAIGIPLVLVLIIGML